MLTWLADALRAEGLDVAEVPGWQTRRAVRRDGTSPFAPRGVLLHHTADRANTGPADDADDAGLVRLVTDGRADLPGPLYQVLITRNARCHVIAAGRANHAGRGSWPGITRDNGNAELVGVCMENDGVGEAYPAAQLDAAVRTCRVIGARVGGILAMHREYSSEGKIDPTGIDGNAWRALVQQEDLTMADISAILAAIDEAKQTTIRHVEALRPSFDDVKRHTEHVARVTAAEVVRQLSTGGTDGQPVDPDAIADRVADELARRLSAE